MTIRYVIAVDIPGVNRVRACYAIHDGMYIRRVGRRYVIAVSVMAIYGGFVECTSRAEEKKDAAPCPKITIQSFPAE